MFRPATKHKGRFWQMAGKISDWVSRSFGGNTAELRVTTEIKETISVREPRSVRPAANAQPHSQAKIPPRIVPKFTKQTEGEFEKLADFSSEIANAYQKITAVPTEQKQVFMAQVVASDDPIGTAQKLSHGIWKAHFEPFANKVANDALNEIRRTTGEFGEKRFLEVMSKLGPAANVEEVYNRITRNAPADYHKSRQEKGYHNGIFGSVMRKAPPGTTLVDMIMMAKKKEETASRYWALIGLAIVAITISLLLALRP